jgi:hypothetical protein
MKNFLKKILAFGIFFTVFFILINSFYLVLIMKTDFDFRRRIETLHFHDPNFSILVLGASTTLDGIDTELFTTQGMMSYNMAIGGCSVRTSYIQLSEYLIEYSTKPQYVILGLNSRMVKTFDDNLIHPIVEVTMKEHKYCVMDFPLLKFRWLGLEFLKKIVSRNHRNAKMSYGQVKFQGSISDNTNFTESSLTISRFDTSKWIGEIAKICNQKDIEFIILEMPGFNKAQNNSDIGPFILEFKNGSHAKLYNFASKDFCEIFDKDRDWIGNSHLNEFGAVKFSSELINIIKKQSTTF